MDLVICFCNFWEVRGWSKSEKGGGPEENGGGGGSASFEPCKGVGHPIFQPVSGGVGHDSF